MNRLLRLSSRSPLAWRGAGGGAVLLAVLAATPREPPRRAEGREATTPGTRPLETSSSPSLPKQYSHFPRWEEFEAALERRKQNEKALKILSDSSRHRLFLLRRRLERGEISPEEFETNVALLREQILERAGKVMYGESVPRGAREEFLKRHGCVKIDKGVVDTLQRLGIARIVEMGAGRGHWAEILRKQGGITIEAFDDSSGDCLIPGGEDTERNKKKKSPDESREGEPPTTTMTETPLVKRGNEEVLKTLDKSFALLLVYPPPGDMALKCLRNHRGDTLVYVGEPPQGANANPAFFDALEAEYDLIAAQDLEETFPECFERMYVFKKKTRTGWFW